MKLKKNKKYSAIVIVITTIVIAFEFYHNNFGNIQSNLANQVQLVKCIDGDTAQFTEIGKTRFLFIDTPESTNKIEPYGKQASRYTCDLLKKAKVITYEYDGNKKDRYNRTLAWIFVDNQLLQELIAKEGYVKKYYDYKDNYKYEYRIRKSLNDKYHIFEGE
ncbi:endonuclease YncB(thermonuclease family) [Bacilli bacterium PM5-3]|nr:endonuclease YncB(thermonuclease family) [Bacilli bacterium PM5-3]